MARVELITERTEALSEEQARVFDRVVETRGKMIRPFEVLLHAPKVAEPIAEVGNVMRYHSTVPKHDRELLTLTVGVIHGCAFVWDSHVELARAAGVREELIDGLRGGAEVELTDVEELIMGAARELCTTATMSAERFAALVERYGTEGAVEVAATAGYYTMLGYVMGAADACS